MRGAADTAAGGGTVGVALEGEEDIRRGGGRGRERESGKNI